jgi:hypothetical protein
MTVAVCDTGGNLYTAAVLDTADWTRTTIKCSGGIFSAPGSPICIVSHGNNSTAIDMSWTPTCQDNFCRIHWAYDASERGRLPYPVHGAYVFIGTHEPELLAVNASGNLVAYRMTTRNRFDYAEEFLRVYPLDANRLNNMDTFFYVPYE